VTSEQIRNLARRPHLLAPNRVWRTYTGGKQIDRFRGADDPQDGDMPEEWVASVVKASNVGREHIPDEGLSKIRLEDGSFVSLQELIASDPESFLGKAHAQAYGAHTAVLVKLLDAGERLTIQVHPDRKFAMERFGSPFGKTEAWYVVGGRQIDGEEPYVLLGFHPGVTAQRWKELFDKQDIEGMIGALHRIPVREGEVYLVEGGVPHAIGPGCFLIEIQEPTDYTLRTERTTPRGRPVPDRACHQGLGFEAMLECFHYDCFTLEETLSKWRIAPTVVERTDGGSLTALIRESDTDRFRMNRLQVESEFVLQPEGTFSIAIVLQGKGHLQWETGEMAVAQGQTLLLPASLSALAWTREGGEPLQVVLCYPPRA